jgi:hypothetical protein
MQNQKLILIIAWISSICYGADQEYVNIIHEIARSPVERDLVQSGRYELFKSIMEIYQFAFDMNEKISENLLDKEPRPTPVEGAGLGLYLVFDISPIYLCMPWGRLEIDSGLHSPSLARWVTDSFFRKLTLSFESHEAEQEYKMHNVKLDPSVPITFYGVGKEGLFEIPEKDLKNYRGTSTLITSNIGGNFSCYSVNAIDGKPLPEQKERVQEGQRSIYDISYEWDLLNIMYVRESHINYQQELMRAKQVFIDPESREEY